MVLYDGIDSISTNGSINFTLNLLNKNDESFIVDFGIMKVNLDQRLELKKGKKDSNLLLMVKTTTMNYWIHQR